MLIPTSSSPTNLPNLQYKEGDSLIMHVKEVSKNFGERGHIKILVETFIGKASHWCGTHQYRLQTGKTSSPYFIERIG